MKFSILVANFAASISENVCEELCRAGVFYVVGCDFLMFDVVGRSDAGGVTVLEDGNFVCSGVDFGSPVRKKIV